MSKDLKPAFPPGWNDPPELSYNSSNPPPKSRIRNKRVAFPINSTNSSMPTNSSVPNLPPTTESVNVDNSLANTSKCPE